MIILCLTEPPSLNGRPFAPGGGWYLATREPVPRFYAFRSEALRPDGPLAFELVDRLDPSWMVACIDQETTRQVAARMGLTAWQLIRVEGGRGPVGSPYPLARRVIPRR